MVDVSGAVSIFMKLETQVENNFYFSRIFSPVLSPYLKNGDNTGDMCAVSLFRRGGLDAEAYGLALGAC